MLSKKNNLKYYFIFSLRYILYYQYFFINHSHMSNYYSHVPNIHKYIMKFYLNNLHNFSLLFIS
jgi:hypothetical protein